MTEAENEYSVMSDEQLLAFAAEETGALAPLNQQILEDELKKRNMALPISRMEKENMVKKAKQILLANCGFN